MAGGYHGKLLEIDLSNRKVSERGIEEADVRKYYLGAGLAAKILYEELDPGLDPLDPESPLLFIAGLFAGTIVPGAPKLSVCARSPLTGIWNEATVGGHWPAEFTFTGIDGVILRGKLEAPGYLYITEDGVDFRPAGDLWGKDTYETAEILRAAVDPKARIASVGPAGEALSRIASIVFDVPNSRIAARAGIGAVMGSKNLKAIVVRGTKKPPVARPAELTKQLKADIPEIKKNAVGLTNFGTSGGVEAVELYGDLPVKNWLLGSWREGAKRIAGQAMQPRFLDHHYRCFACPVRCGKIYRNDGRGNYGHGPEYETIGTLGALCLNDNPADLIEANEWCNRYGLDTISAGSLIAFAMEAFEKGIIGLAETGGLDLRWGGPAVVAMVHKIGRREDIGDLLAEGVMRAARVLGRGAEEFAVHTKGLEYPAHDPRAHVGMALNYATASRGACHLEGLTYFLDRGIPLEDLGYKTPPDPHRSDDKPPIVYNMQNYLAVFNPLGLCKFLFLARVGPKQVARWLELVTGWPSDMEDILTVGERLFTLKRLYNVRLGISRKDDVLPPRLFAWAQPDGAAEGVLPDLGNMLYRYYKLRGWTEEGIPSPEKVAELGLEARA
jgi:aldehyde:ferredoxin oxidoreductase